MLIRVATREVQVGMYVDAMEGAWIDNPFWRRSFLIKTEAELDRLRSSAIQHVTIDTTKGRGVTVIPQAERRRQVEAPAVAQPAVYTYKGKEYVVFAAGGNGILTPRLSDQLVAFALPN